MNANNKVDYLELPAKDIGVAKRFFSALWGWSFEDYGPDYASFNDGRLDGGFYTSDKVMSVEAGSALVIFYHSDLEVTSSKVEELGGKVTRDIYTFPGGKRFHFTDPNGNEYAVWSE